MRVQWSAAALRHLQSIYDHIATDSAQYAGRVVDRITTKAASLVTLPESGHFMPEVEDHNVREVFVGKYRLIYRIGDAITVLAVIHGARRIESLEE